MLCARACRLVPQVDHAGAPTTSGVRYIIALFLAELGGSDSDSDSDGDEES